MLTKIALAATALFWFPAMAGHGRFSGRFDDGFLSFQRQPLPETDAETVVEAGVKTVVRQTVVRQPEIVRPHLGKATRPQPDWPVRRAINPHDAALRFVTWMRDYGFTGWMLSDDIGGFYAWFCRDEGFEELSHDDLRARLANLPGVQSGRRRINGPQFADLRRYLASTGRLRTEAHLNRFELFRVAAHEEMQAVVKPRKRRAA